MLLLLGSEGEGVNVWETLPVKLLVPLVLVVGEQVRVAACVMEGEGDWVPLLLVLILPLLVCDHVGVLLKLEVREPVGEPLQLALPVGDWVWLGLDEPLPLVL